MTHATQRARKGREGERPGPGRIKIKIKIRIKIASCLIPSDSANWISIPRPFPFLSQSRAPSWLRVE
jgi:hypothetical protein